MPTSLNNKLVDGFFNYMKNWDDEAKKDIILKLNKSMVSDENKSRDFSLCFGAWNDSRSADEIIDDLRVDRVNSAEIASFE